MARARRSTSSSNGSRTGATRSTSSTPISATERRQEDRRPTAPDEHRTGSAAEEPRHPVRRGGEGVGADRRPLLRRPGRPDRGDAPHPRRREERSEEHTSELQSLMRISYAVLCLKKKKRYKKQENIL